MYEQMFNLTFIFDSGEYDRMGPGATLRVYLEKPDEDQLVRLYTGNDAWSFYHLSHIFEKEYA